jgi:Mce-associated membrane protein
VNLVLVVLALLLVAASAFFFVRAAQASGTDSRSATLSTQYAAVTKAARTETKAFLTVDYRDMDPLINKVLAGAAGKFKTQYDGARAQLKSSAVEAKASSTGKVLSVGISEITSNAAVAFVAADSHVLNKSTNGKTQPRYYRLKLTMVRQGGKWLTSDLSFVS